MDEREIVCCKCESTTIAVSDDVQSGWVINEPGWAVANYSHYCPRCNEKRLRNEGIIKERRRMYPDIMKGE